ncbi:MAG TPA: DUF1302 family protein [Candidatus Binataceae bacterium]|nr:DUF1302 family protein [Candidatus Binataceae bacterium]
MNVGGKSWERLWLLGLVAALALVVGGSASRAYAQQGIMQNLEDSSELHGYVENQEIIRNENYVKGYHLASIRNRLDLQPSGQIIKDATMPTVLGMPLGSGLSVNYFAEIRPGYEGAYDLLTDRFGNHTTGWSGSGYSPFATLGGAGDTGFITGGYNPKRFKALDARDFAFPMPVSMNISDYRVVNNVATSCWGCFNATQSVSNLRFERDDSNLYYYPVREAYLDFRWDFFGSNLIRLGKQQVVWGKADFFRLQDIVNPVDFGQHFFIEPFEDTRIPQLALWFQHRFGDVLGLQDVAGNFVWNFDTFNPVGLGVGGQPWAIDFGDSKKAYAFDNSSVDALACDGSATPGTCNPNHVNTGLDSERIPSWSIKNSGVGMKWDFQLPHPSIRFALTDWWGVGQTPVFVNNNLTLFGDAAHPGQLAQGSIIPASGVNCAKMATLSAGYSGNFGPGLGGLPIVATNARSIHLAKGVAPQTFLNDCGLFQGDQIRYHKDNTLGLSADYFESYTGVVVRVESSWTHNALLNDTDSLDWTTNNDILQYVIGFDRPHFIKFLNPDRTFFSSFQVFETYYPGAHSTNGGKDGLITGTNDFTFTAFTQTHYYRDQIVPLIFAAFGTQGTDATIGGNTEWLINDHWSASVGMDAFLGMSHQHNVGAIAWLNSRTAPQDQAYSESVFGQAHMQAGGAQRNTDDEFWTRIRYRF